MIRDDWEADYNDVNPLWDEPVMSVRMMDDYMAPTIASIQRELRSGGTLRIAPLPRSIYLPEKT